MHAMEPVLFDQPSARERGRAHGELWRDEIASFAAIRLELAVRKGACTTSDELLAVARLHLPVLEHHLPDLYDELLGIAEGSARRPEEIVVLNHYTDLRDVPPAVLGDELGGCTAVHCNTLQGPLLGQTWDMHASAQPFVRMIRVQPRGSDDESVCFTLTGCLGMAGMGQGGVGVTINNLTAIEPQVGVVWPALVRAMIAQPSAVAAKDLLMRTPLSSGHHYMIGDTTDFFGIETSGQRKVTTQIGAKAAHLHTNHCFDPVMRKHETLAARSTTHRRLELASTLFAQQRPASAEALWTLLSSHDGHPQSICSHVDDAEGDPSASKTCGRVVMRLWAGTLMAGFGCGQTEQGQPLEIALERFHAG